MKKAIVAVMSLVLVLGIGFSIKQAVTPEQAFACNFRWSEFGCGDN